MKAAPLPQSVVDQMVRLQSDMYIAIRDYLVSGKASSMKADDLMMALAQETFHVACMSNSIQPHISKAYCSLQKAE